MVASPVDVDLVPSEVTVESTLIPLSPINPCRIETSATAAVEVDVTLVSATLIVELLVTPFAVIRLASVDETGTGSSGSGGGLRATKLQHSPGAEAIKQVHIRSYEMPRPVTFAAVVTPIASMWSFHYRR